MWDLGHVLAFAVWSYLLLSSPEMVGASSTGRQWGIVALFCIVAGSATEAAQSILGGDPSFRDLLRDALGGSIALSWFSPWSRTVPRGMRRSVRSLSAGLVLVACLPLAVALYDERIARAQFPLLADFETPFEKDRWIGSAHTSVDHSAARHGQASLRVEMDASQFSGSFLYYFPRNWARYRFLRLDILNPSSDEIEITCRIHDRRHEEGEQRYEDRFNKSFRFGPGWNDLRIDLAEVARAPVGRTMNLREIRSIGLFASNLPAPRSIFVDYMRLE